MMCGFSAMCEDMQEVRDRLKVIPIERAKLESYGCYVFDLHTAETYPIVPSQRGWIIQNQKGETLPDAD